MLTDEDEQIVSVEELRVQGRVEDSGQLTIKGLGWQMLMDL